MNRAKRYLNEVGRKLSRLSTPKRYGAKRYLNEADRKLSINLFRKSV